MFSLKNKKSVKIEEKKVNQAQNRTKPKSSSKKITKTIFQDPFHYRVQLTPLQFHNQIFQLLLEYVKKLRLETPQKLPREGQERIIKFQKAQKLKQKKSPLSSDKILMGIKKSRLALYQLRKHLKSSQNMKYSPQIIIIFYDERKHQLLQQLLCLVKIMNFPFILLQDNIQINRMLGVRTIGSLCFQEEEISNCLLKFIGKSSIQIPWLIKIDGIIQSDQQI